MMDLPFDFVRTHMVRVIRQYQGHQNDTAVLEACLDRARQCERTVEVNANLRERVSQLEDALWAVRGMLADPQGADVAGALGRIEATLSGEG